MMSKDDSLCMRSGCSEKWTFGWGKNRHRKGYCTVHHRMMRMRHAASSTGKFVPTMEWMIENWPDPLVCPVCKVEMALLVGDDRRRVISLQHDKSGTVRFLCVSCNMRHSATTQDEKSFYNQEDGKLWCNTCKQLLPPEKFYRNSNSSTGRHYKCRSCWAAYCANYRNRVRVKP